MASIAHIDEVLRAFYPQSQKLNKLFLAEMNKAFASLSDQHFDDAIDKHRAGGDSWKVPEPYKLSGSCGVANYSDSKCASLLANAITHHGWADGVTRALHWQLGLSEDVNKAVRDYMVRVGITAEVEPYHGFPFWFQVFCIKMHDEGDVIDAYLYASREAVNEHAKKLYRKQYEFFCDIGNDQAKTYFFIFKKLKAENTNEERKAHFRKFKLKKADDAYAMNEREFHDFRNDQLDVILNTVDAIEQKFEPKKESTPDMFDKDEIPF
tara:strand:- start:1020 stop:1817 length:798 start_codon:yes stop_codon:yes gene_type:complete